MCANWRPVEDSSYSVIYRICYNGSLIEIFERFEIAEGQWAYPHKWEYEMSTKMTLASGEHFHLYTEAFDEDRIYLELEGVQFEAAYNRVMVPIPVHIWEVIRQFPGIDLSLADMTEDDIRDMVVAAVEERVSAWKSAETTGQKNVWSLAGSLIYGDADTPREEQIRLGMEHYLNLRKHRLEVRCAIEALRKENAT